MDVTSLPGILTIDYTNKSMNDKASFQIEFFTSLLATVMEKSSCVCILDTIKRAIKRHGLCVIKSEKILFSYIKDVEECKTDSIE